MTRTLTALLLTLTLAACSRVELAYENADWLGAWRVGSYLELDREQRGRLREGIAAYQAFHRNHRLPTLNGQLDTVDALIADPDPARADVEQVFVDSEQILRTTVSDMIPLAAEILRDLDAAQIDALAGTLAEGREDYLDRMANEREAQVIERTESWVGTLTEAQTQTLEGCVADLPDVTDEWSAWRQQTEQDFLALLRNDAPQDQVEDLLQAWLLEDEARSPALQDYRATSRALWRRCTRTLLTSLTPDQRNSARERLAGYRGDLETVAAR